MKKLIAYILAPVVILIASCQQDKPVVNTKPAAQQEAGLTLQVENNAALQHENLRIYPIVADEATINAHAAQASIKTLDEMMGQKGFRITEVKNFGREQANWYNGLTLLNKTDDAVFIMSGDVVTGGNQDRVNEEDQMAMPGTIRNFPVFCVEHGRSYYYNPEASEEEKKLAAFKGYYSVASPKVRKAVYGGNQGEVWDAVSHVTKANNAGSSTQAYAALENADIVRDRCKSYTDFFTGKFDDMPNAVGMVAVSNGKVIGVEIFGHPQLFQKRVKSLIHSYAVEAASVQDTSNSPGDNTYDIQDAFKHVAGKARKTSTSDETAGKFVHDGEWLHLYSK